MSVNRDTLIGNQGGDHVRIYDVGRPDAEGWLSASVEVQCDGWQGKFSGAFQKGELRGFAEELDRLRISLVGVAQLRPMEPNIALEVKGDGKGHFRIKGEAANTLGCQTSLTFGFEIDQTYLQRIVASLLEADPA